MSFRASNNDTNDNDLLMYGRMFLGFTALLTAFQLYQANGRDEI